MNKGKMSILSNRINRRQMALGSVFTGLAAFTFARMPRQNVIAVSGSIDGIFPSRIGNWSGGPDTDFVMPPDDERKASAIYDDQILSSYSNDRGERIMLVAAYARKQSSMLMVHRPESCYPGSGYTIDSNEPAEVQLNSQLKVPGRFISAHLNSRIEQILYWTRFGNAFASTWDEERLVLALQNLQGIVPDGALIRLSLLGNDPEAALSTLSEFAKSLFEACNSDGKALLAGPLVRAD